MKFKSDFLYNYLKGAPAALSIERTLECEILSKQEFTRPILDIGCGEGLFAYILFDEKIDVGIDPDERELNRCKHYQMYNELIYCSGDKIPKASNSFNTIFSNSTLEHIPDIEAVLKEAHRLLSHGGKMYITVPTNLFDQYNMIFQLLSFCRIRILAEKYRAFFNKFWRHYHYYDYPGWEKLFQKNGFVILNHKKYDSKAVCVLNDFLIPFSIMSFLSKKITNRWVIFPFLRKLTALFLYKILNTIVTNDLKKDRNCGLVFFEITKTDN